MILERIDQALGRLSMDDGSIDSAATTYATKSLASHNCSPSMNLTWKALWPAAFGLCHLDRSHHLCCSSSDKQCQLQQPGTLDKDQQRFCQLQNRQEVVTMVVPWSIHSTLSKINKKYWALVYWLKLQWLTILTLPMISRSWLLQKLEQWHIDAVAKRRFSTKFIGGLQTHSSADHQLGFYWTKHIII